MNPTSCVSYKRGGILIEAAKPNSALQKVVFFTFCERILFLAYYNAQTNLAERERGMYHSSGTSFIRWICRMICTHSYAKYYSCVHRGAPVSHKQKTLLLPAAGILKLVTMDILGLLPRTATGNQLGLIIKELISKLT